MIHSEQTISVIIPTHNRRSSLNRLLDCLGLQTYPAHLIEVIAVANNCIDTTVEFLQSYQAPYTLRYLDSKGNGPAIARNEGAALASGDLFLFLDDDIEPSVGLVEAHVRQHNILNRVVIGYLPLTLPKNAKFYQIELWSWWEGKYFNMSNPAYRYCYEDLLSGNFSLPATLFKKINGFDSTYRCREDYELGIRLINAGANFIFAKDAWGYHRDEVTNLSRSLGRKRLEGRSDIHSSRRYAGLINRIIQNYLPPYKSLSRSAYLFFTVNTPKLSNSLAISMQHSLVLFEWLRMRHTWQRVNYRLHEYWYFRGIIDEFKTLKKLNHFLDTSIPPIDQENDLFLDLKDGIAAVERQLDEKRPTSVLLYYGEQLIGRIPYQFGTEPLRGIHLRSILATKLSEPLSLALAIEDTMHKNTNSNKKPSYSAEESVV